MSVVPSPTPKKTTTLVCGPKHGTCEQRPGESWSDISTSPCSQFTALPHTPHIHEPFAWLYSYMAQNSLHSPGTFLAYFLLSVSSLFSLSLLPLCFLYLPSALAFVILCFLFFLFNFSTLLSPFLLWPSFQPFPFLYPPSVPLSPSSPFFSPSPSPLCSLHEKCEHSLQFC